VLAGVGLDLEPHRHGRRALRRVAEIQRDPALNDRQGKLLTSHDAVGKPASLAGNSDPIGFAWVAHDPLLFLSSLIDRNPAIKSLVARGLYNHAGQIAQVPRSTSEVPSTP
jgi:hypothetical protein